MAGSGGAVAPPGFELIAQRGDGLAERLAAAFADVGGPALLVGMDTPQLTVELLLDGMRRARRATASTPCSGPSLDGGYWSIGLRIAARATVFAGVPMSVDETCAAQRRALAELGMRVHEQPPLLDVDTFEDALAVAAGARGRGSRRRLRPSARGGGRVSAHLSATPVATRVHPMRLYGEGLLPDGGEAAAITVRMSDGTHAPLALDRFLAPADATDEAILAELAGPVLDVGCGPGAICTRSRGAACSGSASTSRPPPSRSRARAARTRSSARSSTRSRGAGTWRSALLLDGNIGIGGDPVRLLERVRSLLTRTARCSSSSIRPALTRAGPSPAREP